MSAGAPLVDMKDISLSFGGIRAVDHVSIDLHPGEVVGWTLGITAGSLVLAWLYRGSGASILLVAVWHIAFNLTAATEAGDGVVAAVTSTLVMVAAVVIIVNDRWLRRSGQRAPCRLCA